MHRYHARDPHEWPFEEGEVVGFGAQGLTRCTAGCRQLGIISRRAVVEGSAPRPSHRSKEGSDSGDGGNSGDDGAGRCRRQQHDTVAVSHNGR
jgi:hypothetical protein